MGNFVIFCQADKVGKADAGVENRLITEQLIASWSSSFSETFLGLLGLSRGSVSELVQTECGSGSSWIGWASIWMDTESHSCGLSKSVEISGEMVAFSSFTISGKGPSTGNTNPQWNSALKISSNGGMSIDGTGNTEQREWNHLRPCSSSTVRPAPRTSPKSKPAMRSRTSVMAKRLASGRLKATGLVLLKDVPFLLLVVKQLRAKVSPKSRWQRVGTNKQVANELLSP